MKLTHFRGVPVMDRELWRYVRLLPRRHFRPFRSFTVGICVARRERRGHTCVRSLARGTRLPCWHPHYSARPSHFRSRKRLRGGAAIALQDRITTRQGLELRNLSIFLISIIFLNTFSGSQLSNCDIKCALECFLIDLISHTRLHVCTKEEFFKITCAKSIKSRKEA